MNVGCFSSSELTFCDLIGIFGEEAATPGFVEYDDGIFPMPCIGELSSDLFAASVVETRKLAFDAEGFRVSGRSTCVIKLLGSSAGAMLADCWLPSGRGELMRSGSAPLLGDVLSLSVLI